MLIKLDLTEVNQVLTLMRMSHPYLKVIPISNSYVIIDLGIDIDKIKQKLISVITQRGIKENSDYDDMAGPLLVCVLFGFLLLCVS
jgi:hypothetical protein